MPRRFSSRASLSIDEGVIEQWARTVPRDTNTGLRCGRLVGVDIDVSDPTLAETIEALATAIIGPTPLKRVGRAPRLLLAYRQDQPLPKTETPELVMPDGEKAQVEVLRDGQQFVTAGIHPTTRQPYQWQGARPEDTPLSAVPLADPGRVAAFVAAAESILRDAGGRTEKEIAAEKAPAQMREPKAEPRKAAGGESFFKRTNTAALANCDAWVKALFPAARWQDNATTPPGAWRVTSKDLGRGLEEDLAIHTTEGCQDFGTRESLTPIDLVMRWGGAPDAPSAAFWLCERLGVSPASLGWVEATARDEAPPPAMPAPNMAILTRSAATAPEMPVDVFGPFWRAWITRTAEGSNAPIDYVGMPVLAIASALLGNARWAAAWRGWAEPPALWCCSVGNPSSGKSAGAAPVTRDTLRKVEAHMGRDYPAELERWETVASVGRSAMKAWEKEVAAAIKRGEPVPDRPKEAVIPPKPIRPRASVSDATVEALAPLLAGLPKGVLHLRDELAGWLLNMSRYSNGGSDRPFWLEAYTGGPYQVDRVKHPEPVFVPHLTIPVFGTIQPDRLGETLEDADDGLASRFLWAWPDTVRAFRMPRDAGDPHQAATAFQRLANLEMPKDEKGDRYPWYVKLTPDAQAVLVDFARDMQAREPGAHGLLKSSIGKARGQALRLALVLEYLWWCGGDETAPEPAEISAAAMQAAAGLMDAYFLPMAGRVLGDASIPTAERNARTLAAWLIETKPETVNVSAIRDGARLPGLRDSDAVKAAVQFLAEAHWLTKAPGTGAAGRPRGDWVVNPKIYGGGA